MIVELLEEAGWHPAMLGMRLSHGKESDTEYLNDSVVLGEKDSALLHKLIKSGDSHAVALRMVETWWYIEAPRYWWCQMDRYRIGKEQASASTMHTLMSGVDESDFTETTPADSINAVQKAIAAKDFDAAKSALPEGFLQQRIVKISYPTLLRIIKDRSKHRLPEWQEFISAALDQLEHPEFLDNNY